MKGLHNVEGLQLQINNVVTVLNEYIVESVICMRRRYKSEDLLRLTWYLFT